MPEKVFVYGTLRTGDCRHGVGCFVQMLAPVAFVEHFAMLDLGGFPGLVPVSPQDDDGLLIRGEVHEYEDLATLDRIEGYVESAPEQGLYNRSQVTVYTPDDCFENVWVYVFNGEFDDLYRRRIVASGDWFEHRGYYERLKGSGV